MKKKSTGKTPSSAINKLKKVHERNAEELQKKYQIDGVPDLTGKQLSKTLDANIVGLEKFKKQLTETQKKILNVIVSDFSEESKADIDKRGDMQVFNRLRAACIRAGMLHDRGEQAEFFRTLADPDFQHVVKTVGTGLVGMYVVPLMCKQIELAMSGSQTALDRLFELMGLKQSKYDFYLQRVALKKTNINVEGDMNFNKKTDKELEEIIASFENVGEAETVACGD